jgi:hypothetical protein
MAIKFEKIEPGMRLMDIHRERMGNTTMSAWGRWDVVIVSVDRDKRTAVVRWNGNREETWDRHSLERLYTKEPKAYRDQQERRKKGSWC